MNKNATITIDTSKIKEVDVVLTLDEKQYNRHESLDRTRAQQVLPLIVSLMEEHAVSASDVQAIHVHPGPGSFTGLRVGYAIANILGYLWHVPVNGLLVGEQALPVYQ